MKIAYTTIYDSSDIHSWSGTGSFMRRALKESGLDLHDVKNLRMDPVSFCTSASKKMYYKLIARRDHLPIYDSVVQKSYEKAIRHKLSNHDLDVVFTPGSTLQAAIKSIKPRVFWADACFAGLVGFYPGYSNLSKESLRNGHMTEQQALSNSDLAIYSSDWAAATAIQHYDVDLDKVKVVPFGANIECNRTAASVKSIIEGKERNHCKLLFVGVDWNRKGGDKALAVAVELNRLGLETELHVLGCRPPRDCPEFVKVHGYISKSSEAGRNQIAQLFMQSHFLILPTVAECCAVVFSEAFSYGLPCITTNVGGNTTAVKNGQNGWAFDIDALVSDYCNYIGSVFSSEAQYVTLAEGSFRDYSERLNWGVAGREVNRLLNQMLG